MTEPAMGGKSVDQYTEQETKHVSRPPCVGLAPLVISQSKA